MKGGVVYEESAENTPYSFWQRLAYARRIMKDKDNKNLIRFAYSHRKEMLYRGKMLRFKWHKHL